MFMFLKYRTPGSVAVILAYVHPETLEFYLKMREVLSAVGLLGMNTRMAAKTHLPPDLKPSLLSAVQCACDPRLMWNNRTLFLNMDTTCVLLDSLVKRSRGCRSRARHFQDWYVRHVVLGKGYLKSADETPILRVIENQFRWKFASEDMVYVVETSNEDGEYSLGEFATQLRARHRQHHARGDENLGSMDASDEPDDGSQPERSQPERYQPPPARSQLARSQPARSHVGPATMPVGPRPPVVHLPVGPLPPTEPTPVESTDHPSTDETSDAVLHLMESMTSEVVMDMTFTAKMLKVVVENDRLNVSVKDVDNFVV